MQSDQVRIDLLAHANEGLDECGTQLRAEQSPGLQHRAEGEYLRRLQMLEEEPHQRGQADGLTHCLHELRWQEVGANPILRELARHEAAAADGCEAERQHEAWLHETQNCRGDRSYEELRQSNPDQNAADFYGTIVVHRDQELRDDIG